MSDFADRLDAARRLVELLRAIPLPAVPGHLLDQAQAASADAHRDIHRLAAVLRAFDPQRGWRATWACEGGSPMGDSSPADEFEVRILAALAGAVVCPHLRRAPLQPGWALLALGRISCRRCLATRRHPPAGEDDRCDWCGARGVERFTPLAVQRGPLVVLGDACPTCAAELDTEGAA